MRLHFFPETDAADPSRADSPASALASPPAVVIAPKARFRFRTLPFATAFRPRAIDGRVTPADADLIFESIAVDREEQLVGGVVPAQGLCGTRVYLALPDLQPKMQCHLVVHNVGVVDVRASLFLLDSSEEHRLLCRPRRTLPFRCPVCTEPMVVLWPSPVLIGDFGSDAGVRIVHARESASCKLAVDRNLLTELDDRICERDAGAADKDPTWKTKSDDTLARARQHLVRKTA